MILLTLLKKYLFSILSLVSFTLFSMNASADTEGKTTFIPIAVSDITIFIPIMSGPKNISLGATGVDGSYLITWDGIGQAAYYQIIVTDENGQTHIYKVYGTDFNLSGLALGSNKVEIQACNSQNQCGIPSFIQMVTRGVTIRYIHNDVLGSPIAKSDESGNIISRSHYKPFGETLEAAKEGVGYTGHLNDTDLGLTYMQARYYDPVIGRFYSNDPVGFRDVHSFNRYAYANNNPYKYTDLDGKESSFAIRLDQRVKRLASGEITKTQYSAENKAEAIGGVVGAAVVLTRGAAALPIIKKLVKETITDAKKEVASQVLSAAIEIGANSLGVQGNIPDQNNDSLNGNSKRSDESSQSIAKTKKNKAKTELKPKPKPKPKPKFRRRKF